MTELDLTGWSHWALGHRGWLPSTVAGYGRTLRRAHRWTLEHRQIGLLRANEDDWLAWWGSLSQGTRNTGRTTARAFTSWLIDTGRRSTDPAAAIPRVRVAKTLPRPVPERTAMTITDIATVADPAAAAMTLLQLWCGLRLTEARWLRWDDVAGDFLHVTGKGGHRRSVPLPHPPAVALQRLEAEQHPGEWVFPSPRDHTKPLSEYSARRMVVNLAGCRPHELRHTYATALLKASGDLRAVQEALGHRWPSTTAIYTQVSNSRLADVAEGLYA